MGNIGFSELIVILMLLVLVFGASRLPQLGESLGKAVRGLKRSMAENDDIEITKVKSSSSSADSKATAQDTEASAGEHKS